MGRTGSCHGQLTQKSNPVSELGIIAGGLLWAVTFGFIVWRAERDSSRDKLRKGGSAESRGAGDDDIRWTRCDNNRDAE